MSNHLQVLAVVFTIALCRPCMAEGAPATRPSATPAERISDHRFTLDGTGEFATYLLYEPDPATPKEQRWLLVYLYGAGGSTKSYNLKRPPYEEIRRALVANGAYILVPELGPSHFMNDAAKKTLSQIIDRVLADQQIDTTRVHLMGTSMGGGSALALAIHQPTRIRSVCAIMPMTDYAQWANERPKYAKRLAGAYGGTVEQTPQQYDANSATKHLKSFAKIPIFLLHGTADEIVPFHHSQVLADALRAKGYPCTLRVVPDGAHADAIVSNVQSEIVSFFLALQP
jgi:dipeptidyl aminopeptidase/acylaminoacyl peptidase